MELLQKLIDQKTSSSSPPASTSTKLVAQKGNFLMDLITQMEKQNPWIVDFNASHHMTSNATPFHNYNPSSGNFMEWIVDGSLSRMARIVCIAITNDLVLNYAFFILNLTYNLLFIRKLTKNLNCITIFFSNHYEFPDLELKRMIGNAKECVRLYLLKSPNNPKK